MNLSKSYMFRLKKYNRVWRNETQKVKYFKYKSEEFKAIFRRIEYNIVEQNKI